MQDRLEKMLEHQVESYYKSRYILYCISATFTDLLKNTYANIIAFIQYNKNNIEFIVDNHA